MRPTPDEPGSTITVGHKAGADEQARPPASAEAERPDYLSLSMISPDHYVMGEQLARGGMGRVTRARDRRLGREVAIKSVVKRVPELAVRLEREARITARLHHPAIVAIHEAGLWPDQEPFYAMELVSGRPLGQVIEETRTLDERLALLPHVIAVADALAYAHSRRIIHRDLKPSNVLVGEFGETVVIDWGLAKDLADDKPEPAPYPSASNSAETVAGTILGTPAYMPPEQAAGKVVDERADVYSIGAMLYHLLAGTAPYARGSSDEVIAAVLEGPPQPIAARVPGAPSDLVTIVNKAMQPLAEDRYPSARELAEDLKKFQTGQLVGSHRYTFWQLVRRWLRRHRAVVTVASAMLAVVIVVLVVSVLRIVRARTVAEEQQHLAETQRAVAEQEAERARKAELQVQTQLDQLRTEQAARSRAESEARSKGNEAEMSKEQLQVALSRAREEKLAAEKARTVAEEESRKARDAEQRAQQAAAAEKKVREETERLYQEEKARAKALEAAPAKGITTRLPK